MFVEILVAGLPYCVRAAQIADSRPRSAMTSEFRYVDINVAGLTKDDLP